jgi:hypothetical protein
MSKKIGIIGTGVVGKALATGFIQSGYSVMVGSRDSEKLDKLKSEVSSTLLTGSFSDAAKFGEIVAFTVKGSVAEAALKLLGPDNLVGKIVIDTTNPIADAPPVNGVLQFFTSPNDSLMEKLQAAAPKANFVKAWSCVGSMFMINPTFPGGPPTMFICGNNASAKKSVEDLLKQFGWECEDMGSVEAARAIEPLCQLWCIPGLIGGRWTHAFKLLKL